MKKYLYLLLIIPSILKAQEIDTLSMDTLAVDLEEEDTVAMPKHTWGAYLLLGVSLSPNPMGAKEVVMIGGAVKYDRFELGFLKSDFNGSIQRRLVFPNTFVLEYRFGGGFLSYDVLRSGYFLGSVNLSYKRGDMVWKRLDSGEDFLRTTFNAYQVGVRMETTYLRYLRPGVTIGYQRLFNFQLTNLSREDFSGLFFGFNVKIGYFKQ